MIREKWVENTESEFEEKCRKALERSWGIEIPIPKRKMK